MNMTTQKENEKQKTTKIANKLWSKPPVMTILKKKLGVYIQAAARSGVCGTRGR